MKKNMWLDAVMGTVVGDALGVPVEFKSRIELERNPVVGMREYGTHYQPAGTWSDDSSMMLATLDSLSNGYDLEDMMVKFALWVEEGEYTPYGEVFDIGNTCSRAIMQYCVAGDIKSCGRKTEMDNGNGSLMRIMPICLYAYTKQKNEGLSDEEAISMVHDVSALTHAHLRSKIACGLYYFMVRSILDNSGSLKERLQLGMDRGYAYYAEKVASRLEVFHYGRLRDIEAFAKTDKDEIESSGYVVASLEAAVWCLLTTDTYKECVLKAVNLGRDTDTVAAIAGGLAGLYYGYESIPMEWLNIIAEREWIEKLVSAVCVDMGDYVESIYTFPICNHTREVSANNIGYSQGIMCNGIPFEAELWKCADSLNVSFVLPQIYRADESVVDSGLKKDNILGFRTREERIHEGVLVIGMVDNGFIEGYEELIRYVELLKDNGLIEYVGQMENAGGLRCTDIEGNDIIYISITLEEKHEKWARVNLNFRDFPNRVVKSNFRLLK